MAEEEESVETGEEEGEEGSMKSRATRKSETPSSPDSEPATEFVPPEGFVDEVRRVGTTDGSPVSRCIWPFGSSQEYCSCSNRAKVSPTYGPLDLAKNIAPVPSVREGLACVEG